MIVLDTNVVSEAMKVDVAPQVRAWLNAQAAETLYLTSVTLAELRYGVAIMPSGRRKDSLMRACDSVFGLFSDRVLPFDADAAHHYAALAATARASGRGFPTPDGYIAAIAASHGFIVASRDAGPFQAGGLRVINPWEA
jgi:predicted nucleic acid-binding protein